MLCLFFLWKGWTHEKNVLSHGKVNRFIDVLFFFHWTTHPCFQQDKFKQGTRFSQLLPILPILQLPHQHIIAKSVI